MSDLLLLKLTTYETYEYDPELMVQIHDLEFANYSLRHPHLTRQELLEGFALDLFELHAGSQYGDGLFYLLDMDSSREILPVEES